MSTLQQRVASLIAAEPFALPQAEKDAVLLPLLTELSALHRDRCPPYGRVASALFGDRSPSGLAEIPHLPVSLFKLHDLLSVPAAEVTTTLTSSGTTGQVPSRIFLDSVTADLQARALASIFRSVLGERRLPMLIVDSQEIIRNPRAFSARAAGVLGMMRFGRDHTWALDAELQPDIATIRAFLEKHAGTPCLIFGFTWIVWQHFAPALESAGLDFSMATLVHSGGWKKLEEARVDPKTFKARFVRAANLHRVVNFYGMVEQVGSVFVEDEDGLLRPPCFADIIIRDPMTFEPMPMGEAGLIEVLSVLPFSYPGHALLTEDLGVIDRVDSCDRGGKAIRVLGRLPKSELRGCSDVVASMERVL